MSNKTEIINGIETKAIFFSEKKEIKKVCILYGDIQSFLRKQLTYMDKGNYFIFFIQQLTDRIYCFNVDRKENDIILNYIEILDFDDFENMYNNEYSKVINMSIKKHIDKVKKNRIAKVKKEKESDNNFSLESSFIDCNIS